MAADLAVSCRCGGLRARLSGQGAGTRVICYCRDCQAYARHLGPEGVLDAHGGTEIYQTTPDRLEFTAGSERLAVLRMSRKGLLRWYAECCRTPIANTVPRAGFSFVGMPLVAFGDPAARDAMGRRVATVHSRFAHPPDPRLQDRGHLMAGWGILTRAATMRLTGRMGTPFFGPDGAPVAEPHVLTLQERRAAYSA